jgi:hypothetical protein
MPATLDLTGIRFGRLVVVDQVKHAQSFSRPRVTWRCRCDCGNETLVTSDALRAKANNTSSCGCLRLDAITKHDAYQTPEFKAWQGMLRRCYNSNDLKFEYWGGRGISVCDRWRFGENDQHPFECFLADVGPRPPGKIRIRSRFSIDRIDNEGDYEPGNVRWATSIEQRHNRR